MNRFAMYQDAVVVPMGAWGRSRLRKLRDSEYGRHGNQTGSGFGRDISRWLDRQNAYPTNVLHFAAETGSEGHHSAFPEQLPAWFIRLFTQPGDLVLDPFAGSGTTCVAAARLGLA
jgi:site-specific DNA-methyltransferase (adenine-specific)